MKRPAPRRESPLLQNARERKIIGRPEAHELDSVRNRPENLERALRMLRQAVGAEWVSDDPAIACGYARDQSFLPAVYPHMIVLPASTQEVAEVYRIANECLVDVMPYGTGISTVGATIPMFGGIECDLRRMDRILELDGRNMYTRIQPGVNFAELQAEAQALGLRVTNPSTSATAGVISNIASCNINSMCCKYGFGMDNIIDIEMVLPSGEILEAGPRACGMDPAHVPGPGPDVAPFFRYSCGTLGIVTEMTLRLYPEPACDRKFYASYNEDRLDDIVDAFYAIARDNLASELLHIQNTFFGNFMAETNQEAEQLVGMIPRNNIMAILGGASEEEARLKADLTRRRVEETGRFEFLDPDAVDEMARAKGLKPERQMKYLRESVRVQRVKGSFLIGALVDHLDNFEGIEKAMRRVTTQQIGTNQGVFRPDDAGIYFQPYHMGRMAYLEYDLYMDQSDPEDLVRMLLGYFRATLTGMANGALFAAGVGSLLKGLPMLDMALPMMMPGMSVYMDTVSALKMELDPNNVSNRRWDYETGVMPKFSLF